MYDEVPGVNLLININDVANKSIITPMNILVICPPPVRELVNLVDH